MKILGDIHGNLHRLSRVMRDTEDDVLCVGDVGIGFKGVGQHPSLSERFHFIRGNHDWPYWCKKHPQFTLDYGMWRDMFLLGGARSVDKEWRTENVNWWADEELSYGELQKAIELYAEEKPNVVISHEAPFQIAAELKAHVQALDPGLAAFGEPTPYSTSMAMDQMLEIHQPDLWVFGHWHATWSKQVGKTRFICANIFELLDVDEQLALSHAEAE